MSEDTAQQKARTWNEVLEGVGVEVSEALGVEKVEVTPASMVFHRFEVAQIDYLDIVIRLERRFGIKIPRGEMVPEGIVHLLGLGADHTADSRFDPYTVQHFADFVAGKLGLLDVTGPKPSGFASV